jgi:choline kinase|tara:strand:+ start:275 stop:1030 length:756 start_codon:yes stop_codon:yes gene_type:complete
MKVIFLAAGYGKRLGNLTKNLPKCLLDINGQTILERDMNAFLENGITNFNIITGPHYEKFNFENVNYIQDLDYEHHDVLGTLMKARNLLDDDVIISYTDIVYDTSIVKKLLNFEGDIGLAVDMNWKEGYVERTDHPIAEAANVLLKNNSISNIGHKIEQFGEYDDNMLGEFLGIMKLSKKGANMLRNRYEELEKLSISTFHEDRNFASGYIVDIIQDMINQGITVNPVKISGNWCEIDTLQDLENSKKKFF